MASFYFEAVFTLEMLLLLFAFLLDSRLRLHQLESQTSHYLGLLMNFENLPPFLLQQLVLQGASGLP